MADIALIFTGHKIIILDTTIPEKTLMLIFRLFGLRRTFGRNFNFHVNIIKKNLYAQKLCAENLPDLR